MTRMLRGVVAALGVGAFLMPASAQPAGRPAPALIVDADPSHPVFAGSVRVAVERPAERVELLAAVNVQPSDDQNQAATDALLRLVRATLPSVAATAHAATTNPGPPGMPNFGGGRYGGFVRIDLAHPVDDIVLRHTVARVMAAIGALRASDPVRSARIVSIGKGYASCGAFAERGATAARERVTGYARALGIPGAASPSLQDATRPLRPTDGPASDEPLCGDAHVTRPTAIERPTSATSIVHRTYAFVEPMTAVRAYPAVPAESVPPLWAGPFGDVALRLRSRRPLITLEGHALVERRSNGTIYEYAGPNGRYFQRDVTEERLADVRRRLHAIGIADADITTEIDPFVGRYEITVRTPGVALDERVAAAIGGTNAAEVHAVRAAPYGPCAASPDAIALAAADAASRAARIAASLGTTVDLNHPVAIVLQHGDGVGNCIEGSNLPAYPEPIERRIGGALRAHSMRPDVDDVAVVATFALAGALRAGGVEAPAASDAQNSYAARFGFAPPPFTYPDATRSGEARRERSLPPERVRILLQLSPDNANGFRPIDPRFAASLAAQLGAPDTGYAAWALPSQTNLPSGDPEPDGLDFVAVLPYLGEKTVRAAEGALHATYSVGYGGFDVVPQRDACADAAVALARDTIRAAAAQAGAPAGARLVAIDLRGPFSVEGLCRAGAGGPQNWSIRRVVVPDVRLAAYARVSYAR